MVALGVRLIAVLAVLAVGALAPAASRADDGAAVVTGSVPGYDWTLPPGVERAPNSGLFSELPAAGIDVRGVDVTWKQVQPSPGPISTTRKASVYGTPLASRRHLQLAGRAFVVVTFQQRDDDDRSYAVLGDRLVTVRHDEKGHAQGAGENQDYRIERSLQLLP